MADPQPGAGASRRLLALLAVTGSLLVATWLSVGNDRSAGLISAEPPAGAVVGVPPASVVLTFSGRLDPSRTHVAVVGPDGRPIEAGKPRVVEDAVVQAIEAGDEGTIAVSYHAVLASGGEVIGSYQFVLGVRPPAEADPVRPPGGGGHIHGEFGPLAAGVALLITVGAVVLMVGLFRRP